MTVTIVIDITRASKRFRANAYSILRSRSGLGNGSSRMSNG